MISVQHVSKFFNGKPAVDDISFEVGAGDNFILLGPSGCGKTSTLKMINRLIEADKGTVTIDGTDIRRQHPDKLRRNIGYVLQRNSLFPHYTVAENISTVPGILAWEKIKTKNRVNELLEKLHLAADIADRFPHELSGGETQRVNLARALAANPSILLMDEPFSSLDTITKKALRKEFMELDELRNKTIVMVTHDVSEAFEMGDTICLMNNGRLVQQGSATELLYQPADTFVQQFLSPDWLQLSMAVTPISRVWDLLLGDDNSEDDSDAGYFAGTMVGKILAEVNDKNDCQKIITIGDNHTGEWKRTSWQNLLDAFAQLQQNILIKNKQ